MDPSLALAVGNGLQTNLSQLQTEFTNLGNQFLQQRYNQKMYERQRADAISFWNMQNEYNTPANQVARLRAAGLNPAFAYGNGGNNGSPVQVPDQQRVDFRSVTPQGTQRIDPLMVADLRIKNAQANNLETQTEVIRQDARLRNIQATRGELDYNLEKDLFSVNADARRENLRKTQIENSVTLNRDLRESISNASSVYEAMERIKLMQDQRVSNAQSRSQSRAEIARIRAETSRIKQTIEIMQKEGVIKDWEVKLSEKNLRPGDPMWVRLLTDYLTDVLAPHGSSPKDIPLQQYPEIRKPDGSKY